MYNVISIRVLLYSFRIPDGRRFSLKKRLAQISIKKFQNFETAKLRSSEILDDAK